MLASVATVPIRGQAKPTPLLTESQILFEAPSKALGRSASGSVILLVRDGYAYRPSPKALTKMVPRNTVFRRRMVLIVLSVDVGQDRGVLSSVLVDASRELSGQVSPLHCHPSLFAGHTYGRHVVGYICQIESRETSSATSYRTSNVILMGLEHEHRRFMKSYGQTSKRARTISGKCFEPRHLRWQVERER